MDLEGRTILLTGASKGIGAATATRLLDGGATLLAHYGADRAGAEAVVADRPEGRAQLLQADLAQAGAGRRLWAQAEGLAERIDTVVVNAATMPDTALDGSDEDWDDGWELALRVNVIEAVGLVRAAVNAFAAQGGGTVIVLSSWAAQRGSAIPKLGAYAASKAALQSFAQTVARNYARDGVLAHIVAPGIVRTRLSEASAAHRGGLDAVNAALAMGRMVEPEEVAELIAFLATGRCDSLSGATLDVNGASNVR